MKGMIQQNQIESRTNLKFPLARKLRSIKFPKLSNIKCYIVFWSMAMKETTNFWFCKKINNYFCLNEYCNSYTFRKVSSVIGKKFPASKHKSFWDRWRNILKTFLNSRFWLYHFMLYIAFARSSPEVLIVSP